jgi:hypothetical protein
MNLGSETFSCRFSDGSEAATRVDFDFVLDAVKQRKALDEGLDVTWPGRKPHPRVIPEYVAWMHTVMQQTARRINAEILRVYPTNDARQMICFAYHPNGTFDELH